MTIAIYGRGLANKAGIGRYTRELIRSMLSQPRNHEFRLLAGSGVPNTFAGASMVNLGNRNGRVSEEQIRLAAELRRMQPDIYHNPDFTLPFRIPGSIRAVVTVHDVAYLRLPKSNSVKSKVLLNMLVPWSVKRANSIITVSEFSKREIVDVYKVHPSKVTVIPNGVDPRFSPPPPDQVSRVRQKYKLPERTILYVGGIEERKNLLRLALAVKQVDGATLALAGGKNRGGEQIVSKAREVLDGRLLELGFFPDEDLPALYAAADVFAYPSLYEGFGIPPLEAMACGTISAASCATSVPEAVGDAAVLFDPMDVEDITRAQNTALEDTELREFLRDRGLQRAREFTWDRVGQQTLHLYETLV